MKKQKIKKAIIPAAGFGTRFLPATKVIPKELVPVVGKPSIHWIVEEIRQSEIKEVIFIISRGKELIIDYFNHNFELESFLEKKGKYELISQINKLNDSIKIASVRQSEQLGLGHAVLMAKEFVGEEPFAVLLPDDIILGSPPCIKQLIEVFGVNNNGVIGIFMAQKEEISSYGIVSGNFVGGGIFKVSGIIEKPKPKEAPTNYAVTGRYVLPPQIFEILERTSEGAGGEIQLTDAIHKLAQVDSVYGVFFKGERFDVGNIGGFIKANIAISVREPEMKSEILRFIKNLKI